MKKYFLTLCSAASLILTGCFASPTMKMSLPSDSAEYNGATVFLHSINDGDFEYVETTTDTTVTLGNLEELVVDSIPPLEYRIGPLDKVKVIVWEHPELTSPLGEYQESGQQIRPDGKLFFPYAGEIQAAGLTAQELRDEITKRLSDKILNDPQVDVQISSHHSSKVTITGAVHHPGYSYFSELPKTIPLAIAGVGGFTSSADTENMELRRDGKIYVIDYKKLFDQNIPLDRILLKPDDQIYVPSTSITQKENHAFLIGELGKTTSISLKKREVSLTEALVSAGGMNKVTASSSSVYVIRNSKKDRIDVYHLDAKNVMSLVIADHFVLEEHDIVYVDASGLATWNRLISQILPSVQTLYYGVQTVRNIQLISNEME